MSCSQGVQGRQGQTQCSHELQSGRIRADLSALMSCSQGRQGRQGQTQCSHELQSGRTRADLSALMSCRRTRADLSALMSCSQGVQGRQGQTQCSHELQSGRTRADLSALMSCSQGRQDRQGQTQCSHELQGAIRMHGGRQAGCESSWASHLMKHRPACIQLTAADRLVKGVCTAFKTKGAKQTASWHIHACARTRTHMQPCYP
eukprot:1159491-Pelagomonas_calceolata.AAC.4